MINSSMFTSEKDDWETPATLFQKLNNEYHFAWDLAATAENAKCKHFLTPADDALKIDWSKLTGNLFLNPPYGRDLKRWVEKSCKTQLWGGRALYY